MVEKIIVNPNEVRGLGDIMSPKSDTDFIEYASNVTEGTDTVYGATEKVFSLEDTFLFTDTTGDTSKYTYDSRCSVSSSNGEITVTWVSGTYIFWANKGGSSTTEFDYTGDFTVEFDLTSTGSNASIQIYDNSATNYYNKSLYQLNESNPCHIKIVKTGQTFKTYVDDVEKTTQQVDSNITGACRVGFRTNTTSTIKFKNFVIYG